MREILFRGKTEKGEWVQGVPFFEEDRCYIIEELFICDEYPCTGAVNSFVIPETVGQYTGLTDRKGDRIFEGDVVKYDGAGIYRIGYVDGVYRLFNAKGYYSVSVHNNYSYLEVIGNIHDNPELLEGEK